MWFIASIPFWIIGAVFAALGLACAAGLLWTWREMSSEKAAEGLQLMIVTLALGGGAFMFAAWVAS